MKINVKIENQTYEVNVGDLNARPIITTIDGQTFEVTPEETVHMAAPVLSAPVVAAPAASPVAAPAPAPAASSTPASKGGNTLVAPIPGVIITIGVKEGDVVKKGQELLVLEAMKMKNSIRAQRDGKVVVIKVKVGDHVTHSQALLELGD